MDASEVVERLCKLSGEVHSNLNGAEAADCFCGKGGFWSNAPNNYGPTHEQGYRNDGGLLEFIETTVRAALKARNDR